MFDKLKKLTLAAAVAASTLVASAGPAEARGRYRGGGDDAAIAIGAGIIGLAVGAAIASDHRGDRYYRGGRYSRGYPRDSYYYDSYPQYQGNYYRDYRRDYRRNWRHDNRRWDRGYYGNNRSHYSNRGDRYYGY